LVGRFKTQLHVHKEVLVQIPFFQNGLKNVQQGAEMRVNMPDEDPEIVCKMIEFMYKGDYTEPRITYQGTAITTGDILEAHRDLLEAHLLTVLNSTAHARNDEPVAPRELQAHHTKLFHAQVFALGERYSYTELCNLAQRYVRKNLIYHGPQLLEYMVAVYEMTGPKSAMRIPNMFGEGGGKFQHGTAWGPNSMKKWVQSWWQHDGGILGARDGEGKLLEAFERCPELARDLLVLVSEVERI